MRGTSSSLTGEYARFGYALALSVALLSPTQLRITSENSLPDSRVASLAIAAFIKLERGVRGGRDVMNC